MQGIVFDISCIRIDIFCKILCVHREGICRVSRIRLSPPTIIITTRLDQSNVLDWKVSSILFKTNLSYHIYRYHVKIQMQVVNLILLKQI